MKRSLRKALRIGALVLGVAVVLAVAAVLLVIFDKPLVRNFIQSRLSKAPGTAVRVGRLDYSLFPFRLTVDAIEYVQEDAYQKMDVSAGRLEAKGDLWKLVRGRRPALETVAVDGLVFRLEQKEVSEEPLDVEAVLTQVSDTLAYAKRITVANARLSMALASSEVSLEGFEISLTPGGAAGEFVYAMGRTGLAVRAKGGGFSLESGLSSSGTLRLVSPFAVEVGLQLDAPRLASGGSDWSLDRVSVETTARFDMGVKELTVSRLKLGLSGLLDLEATAAGRLAQTQFVEAVVAARVEKLEKVAAFLGPRLPGAWRASGLRGRLGLSGKYGFHRTSRQTADNLAVSLTLEDVAFAYPLSGRTLRILGMSGRIDASGPMNDPRLAADLRTSVGPFSADRLNIGVSEVRLAASGSKAAAELSRFEAAIKGLDFDPVPGKRLSFGKASLVGKARLDLVRGDLTLDALEVGLPGVAPLSLSGRLGLGQSPAAMARLESRGLDLPALRAVVSPFLPEDLSTWELGGTADLSLEARRRVGSGKPWAFAGNLALAQARFNDPTFTIAGDGLEPRLKVEGDYAARTGLSFTAALDIGRGESLWKAVYISWDKHPLNLTLSGRYEPSSGAVDGLTARFAFPTIGEVSVTGSAATLSPPAFDMRAEARLSLGPLYSLYTLAGAAEESRMNVEGILGAGLTVRKMDGALSVKGRLTLAGANVEMPASKTLFLGLSAEVPVDYEAGGAGPASAEIPFPEEGFLRIGEFQSPLLTLKPVAVSLRAGRNAMAIEPLALDMFGGRLELGRTTFRLDPAGGSLRGVGSLALREIDIARFPISSPQFKLTGRVRAEFPRLEISTGEIAVAGRGEADVFGGKVVLRDLAVTRPFAADRRISLNIDLLELDLKKLTDEVPFGEVTGIVSGEVRDLVISYGQPEHFEFHLESVPRRGVPQTFSLKAVDNLTVLSSGQQASAGTGGFWMSLARGFRYHKLGIVSTLRNDTFTLNGTIHEGGVEYLVKKPALFGISVINREPEKVISFKEMTSRLKRVGQSEK